MSITVRTVGPSAVVTIDRPGRANALSVDLMGRLTAALGAAASDHLGVVLTGAGGAFCGGADLDDLRADPARLQRALSNLRSTLLALPVPTVAAIEGPCIGGGLEVAMACDARIASRSAVFGIPAARLGVAYPEEGLALLRRRLPHQTLARLFLLDERIGADEAMAAGICARVVDGSVVDAALGVLGRVGDLDRATVAATKARL